MLMAAYGAMRKKAPMEMWPIPTMLFSIDMLGVGGIVFCGKRVMRWRYVKLRSERTFHVSYRYDGLHCFDLIRALVGELGRVSGTICSRRIHVA